MGICMQDYQLTYDVGIAKTLVSATALVGQPPLELEFVGAGETVVRVHTGAERVVTVSVGLLAQVR